MKHEVASDTNSELDVCLAVMTFQISWMLNVKNQAVRERERKRERGREGEREKERQ